ncbi:uncharacterized protein UHOD_11026 [Ustilago sp. UG-2017b]|nr:uncharacterized protein UHOD_11026 [Ustilago sp. UG-2017b]
MFLLITTRSVIEPFLLQILSTSAITLILPNTRFLRSSSHDIRSSCASIRPHDTDVMVYGSSAVFGHPQYDKVRLNDYLAGVAPKILRANCGNKFDNQGMTRGAGYEEVARHGTGQPATTTTPNPPSSSKRTAAEAGLATSQMRPGPRRPVPSQGNINLAYRSVDIAKGTDAEAALERISTAAKGLVERVGINNCSKGLKEEACLEALEDFADAVIGQLQWHANFTDLFGKASDQCS